MTESKPKYSFDEFKLMYESTEKVTDRRLQTNRWNYTICIAVLGAIAALMKYSVGNPAFFYVGLAIVLVLCGMAILFCSLWIGQVRDFKSLNHAKFEILNEMAPELEYTPESPGMLTPFCAFEREWKRLEDVKALQDKGRTDFIALRSTNIEYFIPKAFVVLFAVIAVAVCVVVLPNKSTYAKAANSTGTNTSKQVIQPKTP